MLLSTSLPRNCITRISRVRLSGGGAAKPGWMVQTQHRWGPEIPDKQYFWDHSTYTGLTLWLRGIRPYIDRTVSKASSAACYYLGDCFFLRLKRIVVSHNPDFRLQLVAFVSFGITARIIGVQLGNIYQRVLDSKHIQLLDEARVLKSHNFWQSESEDLDCRVQDYTVDYDHLNNLWKASLQEADDEPNSSKRFQVLCRQLQTGLNVDNNECNTVTQCDSTISPNTTKPSDFIHQTTKKHFSSCSTGGTLLRRPIPLPITWRFNIIPYGKSNADTQTFPLPSHEIPHRAFALNFTYNNLAYDWGDYVNRRDNKNSLMRPTRMLFTDVYIPPTK